MAFKSWFGLITLSFHQLACILLTDIMKNVHFFLSCAQSALHSAPSLCSLANQLNVYAVRLYLVWKNN